MGARSSHFKLGLFILAGLGLIFAGVVFLGLGQVFRETLPAETYFNESVQGLSLGAPVKYRGVEIGRVSRIGFVVSKYPAAQDESNPGDRYVLVEMRITREAVREFAINDVHRDIDKFVTSGLRVRTTTQGLTGVAFLEMNFFNPMDNPPLPISWTPKSLYIPSAPSTMSRIEAAVDSIGRGIKQLQGVDFQRMFDTLSTILVKADAILTEANISEISGLLADNLRNLNAAIQRVEHLLAAPEAETIIPDAAATFATAKQMAQETREDLNRAMQGLQTIMDTLNAASGALEQRLNDPALSEALDGLPATMDNVNNATMDIRRGAVQFDRMLRSLNELLYSRRDDIEAMLDSTRSLLDNLNEISGDARENPSSIIFSAPPKEIEPEELQ